MRMTEPLDTMLYAVVLVVSVLGTHGTPTLSLGFPSFSAFASFAPRGRTEQSTLKPFSGVRVQNDSLRMIYYNLQTVAVVELAPGKLLLNCELMEVYEDEELANLLSDLSRNMISRPLQITFAEMITLMNQCQMLDPPLVTRTPSALTTTTTTAMANIHPEVERRSEHSTTVRAAAGSVTGNGGLLANNPFTLFSGIIPGTKWCGTGDIAANYHDLGKDLNVDKCCRSHDLCPLKIRAYTNRYNLTNNSLYSKSHCQCDDILFNCLKKVNTPTANLMGNIYFNIVQVPCIDENDKGNRKFRNARNNF